MSNIVKNFLCKSVPVIILVALIQFVTFSNIISGSIAIVLVFTYITISVLYSVFMYLKESKGKSSVIADKLFIFRPIAMMITMSVCTTLFLVIMSKIRM